MLNWNERVVLILLLLLPILLHCLRVHHFTANASPQINVVSNLDSLKRAVSSNAFRSMVFWPSNGKEHWQCSDRLQSIFNELHCTPFDNSCTLHNSHANISSILLNLFPEKLRSEECIALIVADMKAMVELFPRDKGLVCRLALMNNVRCPKWHEDYVDVRLLKSYFGAGTEWIDPGITSIRLYNAIRRALGLDLDVSFGKYFNGTEENLVSRAKCGDTMVIRGKNTPGAIPVLHRSPDLLDSSASMRLLFSITL